MKNILKAQSNKKVSCRNNGESGFTLVEVLISMAIFSVGILGLMTSIGTVMDYQKDANDMTQATLLTKEKIEELKAVAANENTLVGGTYGFNYFVGDYKDITIPGTTPPEKFFKISTNTSYSNAGTGEVFDKFTRETTMSIPTGTGGDFTDANQQFIRFVRVDVVTSWTDSRGHPKNVSLSVVMNRRKIFQQ